MPSLQDEDYIILPSTWLKELLLDDQPSHVFTASLQSKTVPTDFTPKKVRIELGRLLAAKDVAETTYKIFLYEETKTAEVWSRRDWDNSISYRIKILQESTANITTLVAAKESQAAVGKWIQDNLNIGVDTYAGKKLSETFCKLKRMPEELKCFPGLEALLNQYGNLNKNT